MFLHLSEGHFILSTSCLMYSFSLAEKGNFREESWCCCCIAVLQKKKIFRKFPVVFWKTEDSVLTSSSSRSTEISGMQIYDEKKLFLSGKLTTPNAQVSFPVKKHTTVLNVCIIHYIHIIHIPLSSVVVSTVLDSC